MSEPKDKQTEKDEAAGQSASTNKEQERAGESASPNTGSDKRRRGGADVIIRKVPKR
jgi:hypothetical protein